MFKVLNRGVLAVLVAAAGTALADGPADSMHKSLQAGPWKVELDIQRPIGPSYNGPLNGGALVTPAEFRETKPSDYWIGLGVMPASPALQSQLNLPENQGLQVFSVYPNSPAQKAGLRDHDVLVKAGKQSLLQVADLIAAVDGSKGKKLSLEVIRGAKPMKIQVEPVKRPDDLQAMEGTPGQTGESDWKMLQRWLDQMPRHPGARGPMRFRIFGPGAILPQPTPLPDDMAVTITRKGNEPAKVTVQQGDQKWEASENDLSKLPAEVRTHVERMLHGVWTSSPFDAPAAPNADRSANAPAHDQMEQQLENMSRRLEQLRKQVEEFHSKEAQPSPKTEKSQGENSRTKRI